MFTRLIASAPKRHPFSLSAWGAVSTLVHGAAVAAVLWVTSRAAAEPATPTFGEVTYLVMPTEPPPVQPVAPPPPAEEPPPPQVVEEPPPPETFQELTVPREVAPTIEPPAVEIEPQDFSGIGVPSDVATEAAPFADTTLAPVSVEFVDRAPELQNLRELRRSMERLYPSTLRAANIQGTAVVQLVVDKDGRVEAEGMSIVSASHPEFAAATRELAGLLRWRPATVNGKPVRVWVRMPVNWTIH